MLGISGDCPSEMSDGDFNIWPPYEVFYIHSMLFNTTSAMKSIHHVSETFEKLPKAKTGDALADLGKIGTATYFDSPRFSTANSPITNYEFTFAF